MNVAEATGAVISDCRRYRYTLERAWATAPRYLMWVMLNPSTADAEKNDNTIRRCIGFAKQLGYTGILVGNLYALRATNPKELRTPPRGIDAVGPLNDRWLRMLAARTERVICAWGQTGPDKQRWQDVRALLLPHMLYTMGFTKAGQPRHPLMLPNETRPEVWV
jgi:hypothetical protein